MRGQMDPRTQEEQDLAEYKAMLRAEFSFRQKVERLRWERDTLAPLVQDYAKQITKGTAAAVEIGDGS